MEAGEEMMVEIMQETDQCFDLETYLSIKLVVMNTILASEEATPSKAFRSPLNVSLPMP